MITAYTVGFNRPDLLQEQKRLIDKFCPEISGLCCIDNSNGHWPERMELTCRVIGVGYAKTPEGKTEHPDALNYIAQLEQKNQSPYWMTLDHDIFPTKPVTLIEKIDKAGFYGIGQTHPPTGKQYLWPGFCCFKRDWLNGRVPNFNGIRGVYRRLDGDCGSELWPLFSEADWKKLHRPSHGYGEIRPLDEYGVQSSGYEIFDDSWIHFTNASHWKGVPMPLDRDKLLRDLVKAL